MHFAYPPRKSSNPPPFRPRSSRLSLLRRSRLRPFLIILTIFLLGWYFLTAQSASGPYREHEPSGSPPGVIVTVVDASLYSSAYLKAVKDNREQYAKRYGAQYWFLAKEMWTDRLGTGYEVYMPKAYDYNTGGYQQSWAKIMAMRHAITKHPEAKFIWYLHQNAFIMDPSKSVEERILAPKQLESMMMKNHPIVPPDSIIKTFESLQGKDAQVVISQDSEGLVSDSVIVRNGDWGKFFTETWLDPLYRSYNFQKAEQHSLVSREYLRSIVFFFNSSRNTLYSGIQRFCRKSPSYRNEPLPLTQV